MKIATHVTVEIEDIIEMVRLHLYNYGLPCGPKAIALYLKEYEYLHPIPSYSTIARILKKRCLTHKRTGYYPEEHIPYVHYDGNSVIEK